MSFREEKYLTYRESDVITRVNYMEELTGDEIHHLFLEVLYNGVHGFCFSLYEDGQKPGDPVSENQIHKRLDILKKYSGWVRTFSCTEGNDLIPGIAKKAGMKTLVGAWLGSDEEKNEMEIKRLISLANEGLVDIAAVGNEVLYREDLSEEKLLEYINRVKEQLPGIPVGYVDAYYEFVQRPALRDISDVILCNCYPYWEGTDFKDSFQHMRQMYQQVADASPGKKVIISETGWPSQGESLGLAYPSRENAMKYFINTQLWAYDNNIEVFYFSSFDEDWKKSSEGEVGAFWGIWDKTGKLKY